VPKETQRRKERKKFVEGVERPLRTGFGGSGRYLKEEMDKDAKKRTEYL